MVIAPVDEASKIQHVREDLAREFPSLPRAVVASEVDEAARRLVDARVRAFVPVLVRAGARTPGALNVITIARRASKPSETRATRSNEIVSSLRPMKIVTGTGGGTESASTRAICSKNARWTGILSPRAKLKTSTGSPGGSFAVH